MNSTHDNGANGRFDEDLDRIGGAYQQLEAEEPPELLDLAIRNSARRAVEKKPRWSRFGWLHGLTTAAVFVLALSVVIHQRENRTAAGEELQFYRTQAAPAASPAKERSPAGASGRVSNELEESTGTAKDLAAPAPPAAEPRGQTLGEALRESRQRAATAPVTQPAVADTDATQAVLQKTSEKKEADKPPQESMADAAEDAGQATSAAAVVVSAPPPSEPAARGDADLQADRQLRAIIAMKRNGDENWKAALKTFVDSHPGYPLPEELKD